MKNYFLKKYFLIFDESGDADNTSADTDDTTKDSKGDGAKNSDDEKKSEKKYSDEDLDKIIAKKLEKWQKQKIAELDEAKKLATMTEQERAEHERDALKAELEELKHKNTVAEMEKTIRAILKENNINTVSDDIVSVLVNDDAEITSNNTKSFIKAFKASVQAEVKAQLAGKSPKAGTPSQGVTKDAIAKEKDPYKRQAMIRQNMNLYKH